MKTLIVLQPFEGYATGDRITDAAEVERLAADPERTGFVQAAADTTDTDEVSK